MTEIIYYVGMDLDPDSEIVLRWIYKEQMNQELPRHLHSTLAYSRQWFPYKASRLTNIVLYPPFGNIWFGDSLVLTYKHPIIYRRHLELRRAGATFDYDEFTGHITLGKVEPNLIDFPITLSNEYYQTWQT